MELCSKKLDWIKICNHQYLIEDTRQGDVVCTECGLVIDKIYCESNLESNLESKWEKIRNFNEEIEQNSQHLRKEKNILKNLCNKLHLNNDVTNAIYKLWTEITAWHYRKNGKIKINSKGLVVMTLYQGLIKEKIPRPISHLCKEVGINPKVVWHWIKLYRQDSTDMIRTENSIKAKDMAEYFLQPLQLTYQEMVTIEEKLDKNENSSFAPRTLLAACAYVFLKETRALYPSVKNTARILGVRVMSLYRCLKSLNL